MFISGQVGNFFILSMTKICGEPVSESYLSLASEDEGVVPMQTTPFPDVVRITPAPGLYPGFTTPSKREEIVGGEIDILSPIPIPPVTDLEQERRPHLADGGRVLLQKAKGNQRIVDSFHANVLTFVVWWPSCGVPLPTNGWTLRSDLSGSSAGLPSGWSCDCQPWPAPSSLRERFPPL